MCGIGGIVSLKGGVCVSRQELLRIRESMAPRGPDGAGFWLAKDKSAGLVHRRLSIIDLSENAAQPMFSTDGRFVIVYNGEIYNYASLRQQLNRRGYKFASNSDTEVILALFALEGVEMLHKLRGMFALAILDCRTGQLFLARDVFGIKPLYWTCDGRFFRFASQVKALLAGGNVSTAPSAAGLTGFYLFGSVPEPWTTHEDIQALPAGHYLVVTPGNQPRLQRYASLSEYWRKAENISRNLAGMQPAEMQERARKAFLDSVRAHLVADVPVGAFLSAGVDSGSLVALMKDVGQEKITTITLGFEEFEGTREDETTLAGMVAKRYGTEHFVCKVSEREFLSDLPRILQAMDQPSIDGINTWFVSKAAAKHGLKVAISGLGGDELLGGYPSFRTLPKWVKWLRVPSRLPWVGELFQQAFSFAEAFAPARINPKIGGLLKYGSNLEGAYFLRRGLFMPWELSGLLDEELLDEGLKKLRPEHLVRERLAPEPPRSAFARIASMEGGIYMRDQLLRDADWAGMAHSLEIRVPLVDRKLYEAVAPLVLATNGKRGKRWLAEAPRMALPDEVINRHKTGFSIPVGRWLERSECMRQLRKHPKLNRNNTPWARRWAWCVEKNLAREGMAS